ncbi:hypothetical protein NQZ68_007047 [Dissostichus eleginoides]|nr:hypothetical protein NQZ68_007047 [Dissostichus eleginoides]
MADWSVYVHLTSSLAGSREWQWEEKKKADEQRGPASANVSMANIRAQASSSLDTQAALHQAHDELAENHTSAEAQLRA